jgi:NAD(P)-dependent dehydrogenase (short-subunit alcohol dehydrogenase family)
VTTARVTGANKGVGFATARALAGQGMKVWLAARSPERGLAAEAVLRAEGGDVTFVQIDVTDPARIAAGIAQIEREDPVLDVLVNNAGIMRESGAAGKRATRPSQVTTGLLRELFDTDVFGPIAMIRACLPLLLRAPAPRVERVEPTGLLRAADGRELAEPGGQPARLQQSKAALNMATVMLAHELRDTNIRINAVTPGIIATDLNGAGVAALRGRPGYGAAEDGAALVVQYTTLPDDGPSGGFFGPGGLMPW